MMVVGAIISAKDGRGRLLVKVLKGKIEEMTVKFSSGAVKEQDRGVSPWTSEGK